MTSIPAKLAYKYWVTLKIYFTLLWFRV